MSCSTVCISDSSALVPSADCLAPLEEHQNGGAGDCVDIPEQFLCHVCAKRYQQPRVLSCLHVFCTPCLEKLVESELGEGDAAGDAVMGKRRGDVLIVCPGCKQETRVVAVGVLPLDVVTMNEMDLTDIRSGRMVCTSCKTEEKAVARCCDCASFLCSNCVTAHKYMRCFENHKVCTIFTAIVVFTVYC